MYNYRSHDNALNQRMEYVLDAVYHDLGIKYKRIKSEQSQESMRKTLQLNGTDILIRGIGNIGFSSMLWVDEKCATRYWDKDLKTYSFELFSKNNPDGKGWFLAQNETTHYMLVWPRCTDAELHCFTSLELMLVSKVDVKHFVEAATKISADALSHCLSESTKAVYFEEGVKVSQSQYLREAPINVIIPKTLLSQIAIFHHILSASDMRTILLSYRSVTVEEKNATIF